MAGAPWWRPWREIEGVTILHVDLSPDTEREARALRLLDDEERARWRRFLSVRARREFALCRAALRATLSERLGCSNRQLAFGYLEHGKPFAQVHGQRTAIGFNVSHSGRHGLIAFAENAWLGVDVEERVPRDGISRASAAWSMARRSGNRWLPPRARTRSTSSSACGA